MFNFDRAALKAALSISVEQLGQNMVRKLLSVVVALAVLLGSVAVVNAGDFTSGTKSGVRHVQGGKKKHKKGAKSGHKKGGKKSAGKGKKHGKIKA